MEIAEIILKRFSKEELLQLGNTIHRVYIQKLPFRERSKLLWDQKQYHRKLYAPPFTPSHDDTRIYVELFSTLEVKEGRQLLLGSTPILRYILNQELNIKEYLVADFSYKAIEGSTETLEYYDHKINTDNEIWIKADWMNLPLKEDLFTYITGDFVFTQVEPSKQQKFIDGLKRLLKDGGRFIGRMYTCDPSRDEKDPQEVISEIVAAKNLENTPEQRTLLLRRLRDRLRDKETKMVATEFILDELLKYETQGTKQADFIRSVVEMSSRRSSLSVPFVSQTQEEIESLFEKNFSIQGKVFATDYDSTFFPFYVLKKK